MTWQIEVRHDGLNAYRVIRGRDRYEVEQKAAMQRRVWDERWSNIVAQRQKKAERERFAFGKAQQRAAAASQTAEAEEAINSLRQLLAEGIRRNPSVNFAENHSAFAVPKPSAARPETIPLPPEATEFSPSLSGALRLPVGDALRNIVTFFWPPLRRKHVAEAHANAVRQWEAHKQLIEARNAELERGHAEAVARWIKEGEEFQAEQEETNRRIREIESEYLACRADGVKEYCDQVLSCSPYPDYFPRAAELSYLESERRLLVDYDLPSPEVLPRTKEVKYSPTKGSLTVYEHSPTFMQRLYDDVVYKLTLRTVHELFEADGAGALDSVAFNGWVHSIDVRTGHAAYAPIVSLFVTRDAFRGLDLAHVEPKACFKQLKGVAASKLAELTPIAPIITIDREDRRFVPSHDVQIAESDNLASMDWEDFEHLVRELFEKEFSQNGGEVHVTRASRDAGVDAVAFDPDPIRGGKIVIQAKRYSNTVDLSAVRDLFGTVINEGATKGILVTTAEFGPDAYEFAKGKPLTLLNGGNLLHLLAKHGRSARIDLREAKRVLQGQTRTARVATDS